MKEKHITTGKKHTRLNYPEFHPSLKVRARMRLSPLENAVMFFFSSLPLVSSYCPCIFHVKPCAHARTFSRITPVFRETCSAVNWFAFCGFKRHGSRFATVSTFNVKHPFLGHIISPLYTCVEKIPVIR